MEAAGSQRGLELRLETLSARIRMLRQKVERTEGIDKILGHAEIAQLERRKKALEERVLKLNRESSGFRRSLKSEAAKLSYDLSSAVEDLMLLIDSGYRTGKRPAQER
jgi:molecular chaperone GrpE (heat shock protein)